MAKVAVVGSGTAGLITAHTLLRDGFDVEVLTCDASPGGVWASARIYDGLKINSVHGAYEFSPLPMPPPANATRTGGRLSAQDVNQYMELFADRFLKNRIRYTTDVHNISKTPTGWIVKVASSKPGFTGETEELRYDKLVLCTGGCHEPHIPEAISPEAAALAGFTGPVIHSSRFAASVEETISNLPAIDKGSGPSIIVVGGGKSAQDIAAHLANRSLRVTMVFDKTDAAVAAPIPLPQFIRNSRFLAVLSPHINLRSRLERWLHLTTVGSSLVRFIWSALTGSSFDALKVPKNSPLRNAHPVFWSIRTNDEGNVNPDGFFLNVARGKIDLVSPARMHSFSPDGSGIMLDDGRTLSAAAVILATGRDSSWAPLFDDVTLHELGLSRHPPLPLTTEASAWNYKSMADPPPAQPPARQQAASMYKAVVPAKNIESRDFAVNGSVFTTNNAYAWEVAAHWISSYFLEDPFLVVPSAQEAEQRAELMGAWLRKRYPDALVWANESHSSDIAFWTWPQWTDDILEDMHLKIYRSGGNWLTWPFKVIDVREIAHLHEERRLLRANQRR